MARRVSILMVLVMAIGCGEETFVDSTAGSLEGNPPVAGQVVPESDESDVAAAARSRSSESDAAPENGRPLRRESVTIEPYTGPAILLDESTAPPPATIVESKRNVTQNFEDGTVQIERQVTRYSDDRLVNDGTFKEFYPNGKLFVEGQYVEGEQVGEWTYWHDNGQKNRTDVYVDGVLEGRWEVFRADGSLEATREFKQGQRHGEWIVYSETGKQPLQEMQFRDGKPHGKWQEWYENGTTKGEYQFDDGVRNGLAVEWDEDGNERARANYRDNKLHGEVVKWDVDGRKYVQVYEDGRLMKSETE